MAGFAIRSRFAGHAIRGAKTRHASRLKPDHPMGAGHHSIGPQATFTIDKNDDRSL